MHQKDAVRSAWKAAGFYDENDLKLAQFMTLLDDPTQCWPEMIDTVRRNYAEYKTRLAKAILGSNDKLVHLAIIRAALPGADDEMSVLKDYIVSSDPVRDETELKAIALKNVKDLNKSLSAKTNLTPAVSAMLVKRAPAT
ncbi:MAG TPA: hypothetical protein VMG98_04275 [Verrucomicrobiae bacterium]|nr:hypothetical protein [Verrucomicrobiae bacterium]HTZ56049.1 hypothetical protein [Candidatus Acidoferrum sp.]